ncbi:MAG: flagellar biosynthetic protein FliR [Alphaproteobacteria bacterium]|jgi:flagellar biosynthetic protein FliR|nr:flagellar biosynthetic protein FliR [Alphaproteobacteria bacterium]
MELAATLVFPFFLVFCRLGAALLVFPALSDDAVPARLRLLAAVAAAAVMVPLLTPTLPTLPGTTGELALLVFAELVMGLLLGLGARLFLAALSLAGELIAFAAGLQAATLFDPGSNANSGAPTVFLTLTGGMLILALNLHHDLIRAVAASYASFPAGQLPPVADVTAAVVQIFAEFSALGLQLAAPVVVAGLLTTALFGLLNRLIPQLQVFFVSVPLTVILALIMLAAALPLMLQVWGGVVSERFSVLQTQ